MAELAYRDTYLSFCIIIITCINIYIFLTALPSESVGLGTAFSVCVRVSSLFNLKLQQFLFNVIQILHSFCTHIEDVHLIHVHVLWTDLSNLEKNLFVELFTHPMPREYIHVPVVYVQCYLCLQQFSHSALFNLYTVIPHILKMLWKIIPQIPMYIQHNPIFAQWYNHIPYIEDVHLLFWTDFTNFQKKIFVRNWVILSFAFLRACQ